jgi:hypothetical protein
MQPPKVLTSSRKVDECKPLGGGALMGAEDWAHTLGRAVQVDPIKPTLKAPKNKALET